MATLASGILTRYQALTPSATQVDQSNPRDDDTSADSTLQTNAATQAADELTPILGSVDDSDTEAVSLGYRLMKLVLAEAALNVPGTEILEAREQVKAEARELRDARRQERVPGAASWHAPADTDGEKRYPAAKRGRGYDSSTEYTG